MDLAQGASMRTRNNANNVANILRVVSTIDKVKNSADALLAAEEMYATPVGFPELVSFLFFALIVLVSMTVVGIVLASPPLLVVFVPCCLLMTLILLVAWVVSHSSRFQTRNAAVGVLFWFSVATLIVIVVPLVNAWFTMHNRFTANVPLPITAFVQGVINNTGVDPRESSGFFEDVVTATTTTSAGLVDSESQSAAGSVTKTVFRVFLDTFEFLAAICVTFLTFFAAVLVYMARAPDTVPPSVQL